jgi:hypothetical protein
MPREITTTVYKYDELEVKMKILKITVVHQRSSVDLLWIKTDLPSPFPAVSSEELTLTVQCKAGYGEEYCKICFKQDPNEVLTIGAFSY